VLLAAGASPNECNDNGVSTLLAAIYRNHFFIAFQLLNAGANPYLQDKKEGFFPLFLAAEKGNAALVSACLMRDASQINQKVIIHSKKSALFVAVELKHKEVIALLLRYGADPNGIQESDQVRPLLKSVQLKDLDVARALLEAGADPNLQNTKGISPLREAVSFGHTALVALLLEYGADPKMKGNLGMTPEEIVNADAYPAVASLLKQHHKIIPIPIKRQAALLSYKRKIFSCFPAKNWANEIMQKDSGFNSEQRHSPKQKPVKI